MVGVATDGQTDRRGTKMTDTFREIEQGYEAKFKLDEELRFKVRSRRNKLFGLWAAGQLGLVDGEAAGLRARAGPPGAGEAGPHRCRRQGHERPVAASGVDVGEREVRAALADAEAAALEQIADAYPMPLGNDHVQVGG